MRPVTRRTFLKYTAATAGALALPQIVRPLEAEATPPACYWGAFPDPNEVGTTYGGDIVKAVVGFESLIGRKLGMTRHYLRWDYTDPGATSPTIPSAAMKTLASGGRTPFQDWRCQRMDDSYVKWSDIVAGAQDTYITSVANAFKTWGKKCFLVFNHEPENDAANMAPGLTLPQAGAQYKAAYKHVQSIFTAVGATKVKWVCTLVQGTYAGTKADGGVAAWFPPSAKYVGVDGYNRGLCSGGWKSFVSLFTPAHDYAVTAGKFMVVEEWGCVTDVVDMTNKCGDGTHTKSQWFLDAGLTMKSWPQLKAVIYTHVDATFRTLDTDFRVNKPSAALANYQAVGNDPYFGGTGSPIS